MAKEMDIVRSITENGRIYIDCEDFAKALHNLVIQIDQNSDSAKITNAIINELNEFIKIGTKS